MKNIKRYFILFVLLNAMILVFLPTFTWANSAEPPSLVILVNNPPEDLSIVLVSNENHIESSERKVAWEGYYIFYSRDMQFEGDYVFQVTTKEESFEIIYNEPLKGYHNTLTLDLSHGTLKQGTYPFRSAILVGLRLLLTLLIEAGIFWMFGFREKRSWLIFLIINLMTQGVLNIWLNSGSALLPSYLIISLILGEIFVFAAEMIGFPIFIREHTKPRLLAYVLIANLISLIAGGYIISILPV